MVKSQKISSIDYCDAGEFNLKSIYLKFFRFSFIVSSFVGNPAVQEDCRWINFMSFIHDYAKTFIRTRVSKLSQKVVHISLQLYIYHYSCTLHIICAQWEIKVWTRILGPLRIFSLLSFRPWRNKIKRSRQNSIAKNKIFQIWSFQINKRLLIQLNFKLFLKIPPLRKASSCALPFLWGWWRWV